MHSDRRTQASKLLSAVADRLHSPRLATLACRISLDAFTHVKKAKKDGAEGFRKASLEKARDDEEPLHFGEYILPGIEHQA